MFCHTIGMDGVKNLDSGDAQLASWNEVLVILCFLQ